jgi:hypothetical protein
VMPLARPGPHPATRAILVNAGTADATKEPSKGPGSSESRFLEPLPIPPAPLVKWCGKEIDVGFERATLLSTHPGPAAEELGFLLGLGGHGICTCHSHTPSWVLGKLGSEASRLRGLIFREKEIASKQGMGVGARELGRNLR